MPSERIARIVAACACLGAVSCNDERPPSSHSGGNRSNASGGAASTSDTSGAGDSGAAGSDASDAGRTATSGSGGGSTGSSSGGAGGSAVDPECGNGLREPGEACDASDFGEYSCQSFGLSEGTLGCDDNCELDISACTGVERCSDGHDNDGDAEIDCADQDCEAACNDACSASESLPEALPIYGEIHGQLAGETASCSPDATKLGQVVYRYEPPVTGVADFLLTSVNADLSLSVRTSCANAGSELECARSAVGLEPATLRIGVTQSEVLYVVVESGDRDTSSGFELLALAREVSCGDGYRDLDEECDDGNMQDDDGCSNACEFQPDEVEPNDTPEQATAYVPPWFFGAISEPSDVDVVSVEVPQGYRLSARTLDLGDGACAMLELDSSLELLTQEGELVDLDDDGGIGFCSALVVSGLAAGTYFVRIAASGAAESFLYRLELELEAP